MASPGPGRLVRAALACYPAGWRRRHGHEGADLAALLIGDGAAARSVACSYLAGAARARLIPPSGRRLAAAACAVLIAAALLSVSMGLLARTAPARAASTTAAHAHCRPAAAAPARTLTPAAGRSAQQRSGEAGHGRGC